MTTVSGVLNDLVARIECPAPALAWGVMIDGHLAASGGRGADAATPFRIASMTKSFTAAAVLGLRDDGVLSLDRPVGEYAPELRAVRGPAGSPAITLRHLLSMAAGLSTDDPWADRHLDATAEFMDDVYAGDVHFAARTGDTFEYSNLGFAMIGRVVRAVTGRPVRDHVDERLLRPLGMTRTTWDRPPGAVALPHRVRDGVVEPDDHDPLADGEIAPMGGLWSTVEDLVRWMAWLDSAHTGVEAPSAPARREMQSIHTYAGQLSLDGVSAPSGYGFGILLRDDPVIGMVAGHSGGLPGYGSNMRWRRGSGVGLVALANVTYAPMSTLTHRALTALVTTGLVATPTVEPDELLSSRAHALVALFGSWDDAVARALCADNVDLDDDFGRRRAEVERHTSGRGARLIAVVPTSRTSGTIEVQCGDSRWAVDFSLSPHRGLVQTWSWRSRS